MTQPIYDDVYAKGVAMLDAMERGDATAPDSDLEKAERMLTFLGAQKDDKGEWRVFPEKRRKVLTETQIIEIARRVYCNDETMSEIADQVPQAPAYTAGPWRAHKDRDEMEWDVMAGGWYVATVRDLATFDGTTERANAHLIAAAPDLLAASARALEQLLEVNPHPVRTIEALRAAIAKAKGAA